MDINRIGLELTDEQTKKMDKKASEIIKSLQNFNYRDAKLTLEKATTELEYRAKAIFDKTVVENTEDITLNF